jgi:hypothetical protein
MSWARFRTPAAALWRPRPAGAPCGYGDLGLHGSPGSNATMMQLIPLWGLHHHAPAGIAMHPGAASCIRCIMFARPSERRPAGTAAAKDPGDLRIIGRLTRPTCQLAPLVAPDASPPRRRMFAAASSLVSHTDGPMRRGRARHTSQSPTGGRSWPGPTTRLGKSVRVITNLGSSLQASRTG